MSDLLGSFKFYCRRVHDLNTKAASVGLLAFSVAIFLFAGYLLLPACALAHIGGRWDVGCPAERERPGDAERAALLREGEDIQRRIDALEAELATRTCEGEHPQVEIEREGTGGDRTELPIPRDGRSGGIAPAGRDGRDLDRFADTGPDLPSVPDTADPYATERKPDEPGTAGPEAEGSEALPDAPRDIADLEGCWELESELEFRLRGGEGGTQPFPEWTVCFEKGAGGNGTQVMRSDDGMLCEGPIEGAFDAEGALVLTEEDDLVCSDGTEIFQRVTTCALNTRGVAVCESVQPSTGGRGNFTLKRN